MYINAKDHLTLFFCQKTVAFFKNAPTFCFKRFGVLFQAPWCFLREVIRYKYSSIKTFYTEL